MHDCEDGVGLVGICCILELIHERRLCYPVFWHYILINFVCIILVCQLYCLVAPDFVKLSL